MLHCLASEMVDEITLVVDGDEYSLVLPDVLCEHAATIDRLVSGIRTVSRDHVVAAEDVA